jgi:hypothetical protein
MKAEEKLVVIRDLIVKTVRDEANFYFDDPEHFGAFVAKVLSIINGTSDPVLDTLINEIEYALVANVGLGRTSNIRLNLITTACEKAKKRRGW